MNRLKKFWIMFLSFLPLSAGAIAPIVVAGIVGLVGNMGVSIYRSMSPANMADAVKFFSSCWSCQMFSDIMATMSGLLPRVYHAIGTTVIPFAAILTAVWFVWKLMSGFMNGKIDEPWSIASAFTNHMIKFVFVCAFLLAPLPRLISDIALEPVFDVGMSLSRGISNNDDFAECLVATAIADPLSASVAAARSGAYSPSMRHDMACELASVHQITGLGMGIGWTMLKMAFDYEYEHKIMWAIPIFPNVFMFFGGALIMVLFFAALMPVPLYFLEVFITISMDLIMLPLMLLSWLFKGWAVFPQGKENIMGIINRFIAGVAGISLITVFITFGIMFLDSVFGKWGGLSVLQTAIEKNDSKFLMDGLMMNNDSVITIVLMGAFIAMFMTSMVALVKTLFANVNVPTNFYEQAKKDADIIWKDLKKIYGSLKK